MDNTIFIRGIKLIKPEDETIDFTQFPFNLSIVRYIENIEFTTPVTLILGDNGIGKSTLIEAIALSLGLNAEGGNKSIRFSTFDSHSDLYKYITLKRLYFPPNAFFLRSETIYSLETKLTEYFEDWKIHEASHGEGIIELMKQYFKPNGIYILDEPESALSPTYQFSFLNLMHRCVTKFNCQFIIATHSPIIAGYEHAKIYEISHVYGPIETKYEDTSVVNLYKRYLNSQEYRDLILQIDD